MDIFFQGFVVGAGLIIAIGAQNIFVLTQSIRKQYHIMIAAICSFSDMLLIAIGTAGVGTLIAQNIYMQEFARWGGAAFLFWIGTQAFRDMIRDSTMEVSRKVYTNRRKIILMTLTFTFLNPHVYLDTVIFLGGMGGLYDVLRERILFAAGASTASLLWFFGLAWAGTIFAPVFARPMSWKLMNCVVGFCMWGIGLQLLL